MSSSLLTPDQVDALFSELRHCDEVLEMAVDYARHVHRRGTPVKSLEQARKWIEQGGVHGLKFRYRHQGGEWSDSIERIGQQLRLIRIRHDPPGPP